MPSALPFYYTDFSNGFNTQDGPFLLDQTVIYARDVLNVQGTTAGAICKRNGNSTFASFGAGEYPMSVFAADTPGALIVATSDITGGSAIGLYTVDTGGLITSFAAIPGASPLWDFISAPVVGGQGPIFGVAGFASTPIRTNGTGGGTGNWTSASGGVAVPNGTMCVYHRNQVFIAGTGNVPAGMAAAPDATSRLYWSAIADPTNWDPASLTGAGFMDFDPKDGQAITGLGVVGPYLLVCKPTKLWLLIDPATATSRQLSTNVGCPAHRSIVPTPEGTLFLSENRGVYLTNGSSLKPMSDKVLPTIKTGATSAHGGFSNAAGAYFDGHYYLSFPNLNTRSLGFTLDFDTRLNSWWKHSFSAAQFATWRIANPFAAPQLFAANGEATIIDKSLAANIWQDNGASFQWYWQGPWQSPTFYRRRRFPTPFARKRFRQMRANGAGTVDVNVAFDMDNVGSSIGSNVFNTAGFTTPVWARFDNLGIGNEWSLKFSATSTSQDIVIAYDMAVTDRRDLQV